MWATTRKLNTNENRVFESQNLPPVNYIHCLTTCLDELVCMIAGMNTPNIFLFLLLMTLAWYLSEMN